MVLTQCNVTDNPRLLAWQPAVPFVIGLVHILFVSLRRFGVWHSSIYLTHSAAHASQCGIIHLKILIWQMHN